MEMFGPNIFGEENEGKGGNTPFSPRKSKTNLKAQNESQNSDNESQNNDLVIENNDQSVPPPPPIPSRSKKDTMSVQLTHSENYIQNNENLEEKSERNHSHFQNQRATVQITSHTTPLDDHQPSNMFFAPIPPPIPPKQSNDQIPSFSQSDQNESSDLSSAPPPPPPPPPSLSSTTSSTPSIPQRSTSNSNSSSGSGSSNAPPLPSVDNERSSLLNSIQSFSKKELKKSVTIDKSQPLTGSKEQDFSQSNGTKKKKKKFHFFF